MINPRIPIQPEPNSLASGLNLRKYLKQIMALGHIQEVWWLLSDSKV